MPSYLNNPSDVNRTGHAVQVTPSLAAKCGIQQLQEHLPWWFLVPQKTAQVSTHSKSVPCRNPAGTAETPGWRLAVPVTTTQSPLQNWEHSALTLLGLTSLGTSSARPFQSLTPLTLRKLHQTSSRSAHVLPTFSFTEVTKLRNFCPPHLMYSESSQVPSQSLLQICFSR